MVSLAGNRGGSSGVGEGQLVRIALSDVAFAMVGHLRRVAEAQLESKDAPGTAIIRTARSGTTSRPATDAE
jgi:hypothetical protein